MNIVLFLPCGLAVGCYHTVSIVSIDIIDPASINTGYARTVETVYSLDLVRHFTSHSPPAAHTCVCGLGVGDDILILDPSASYLSIYVLAWSYCLSSYHHQSH